MRYICRILSLILVITAIGCTNEDFNVSNTESNRMLDLELLMPIPSSLITRNTTNDLDKMVVDPLVLLFDKDDVLLDFNIATKRNNTNYWLPIDADLAEELTKIIVMANYSPAQLDKLVVGEVKDVVLRKFTFVSPLKIENGIPMLGEVVYTKGVKELSINMRRSVASIDVKLAENLKEVDLKKIHIVNNGQLGYIGSWSAGSFSETPISYEVNNGEFVNELFIASVSKTRMESEAPTLLVAEIEKGGKNYFYRMDFVDTNNENLIAPFAISKNNKYEFIINEISGTGWSTVQEAVTNKIDYNFKYEVITWKDGIESMLQYQGKYLGVKNSTILYNDMTSKTTPERVVIQSNINAKDLVFTSNYFVGVITTGGGKDDAGYIDFYPKGSIATIPVTATGTIATKDGKHKRTLNFKKTKDFLEIYDIESNLYGSYMQGTPLTKNDNYIELSLAYKSKVDHIFRVDNLPSKTDPSVKISGSIEFKADGNQTKAKFELSGTPSKAGNIEFEVNLGAVHTQSPVQGLNLTLYASKAGNHRAVKVLIVSKNGGDYANYADLFTVETIASIGTSTTRYDIDNIDLVFTPNFPLESYQDYHVIYYFDSTNILSTTAVDNRADQIKVFKALRNHYENGGGVYYSSDRVNEAGYSAAALAASKLFFETFQHADASISNISLSFRNGQQYAYISETGGTADVNVIEYGKYNTSDTSQSVLVFDNPTSGFRKILSALDSSRKYRGIMGEYNAIGAFYWVGSSTIFINTRTETGVLTVATRRFLREVISMLKKIEEYKYFNRANKEKYVTTSANNKGYVIGFKWNVI